MEASKILSGQELRQGKILVILHGTSWRGHRLWAVHIKYWEFADRKYSRTTLQPNVLNSSGNKFIRWCTVEGTVQWAQWAQLGAFRKKVRSPEIFKNKIMSQFWKISVTLKKLGHLKCSDNSYLGPLWWVGWFSQFERFKFEAGNNYDDIIFPRPVIWLRSMLFNTGWISSGTRAYTGSGPRECVSRANPDQRDL